MTDRPYREIQVRNAALLITEEIAKFVADQDKLEGELETVREEKAELEIDLIKVRATDAKLVSENTELGNWKTAAESWYTNLLVEKDNLESANSQLRANLKGADLERDRLVELHNKNVREIEFLKRTQAPLEGEGVGAITAYVDKLTSGAGLASYSVLVYRLQGTCIQLQKALAEAAALRDRVSQLEQLVDLQSRELSCRKGPSTTIPAPPPTED